MQLNQKSLLVPDINVFFFIETNRASQNSLNLYFIFHAAISTVK